MTIEETKPEEVTSPAPETPTEAEPKGPSSGYLIILLIIAGGIVWSLLRNKKSAE